MAKVTNVIKRKLLQDEHLSEDERNDTFKKHLRTNYTVITGWPKNTQIFEVCIL